MELYLINYINKMLKKANYEYDSAIKSWCASVEELPGAYAQGIPLKMFARNWQR